MAAPDGRRVISDDPDDKADAEELAEKQQQAALQAEKTSDQLLLEAHREWKRYFYPSWGGFMFYLLFVISIIQMVLTLDQWHGTHGWRQPVDFYPKDRRYGGWPYINHNLRFAGAVLGVVGSAFSWVMAPSGDKYRCLCVTNVFAALLLFAAFGYDMHEYTQTTELPICRNKIPDINTHRYICTFEDYRATVILDFLSGAFTMILGIWLCHLAVTGAVSRKKIFDESSGQWVKYVVTGDEDPLNKFPRRFRNQLSAQHFLQMLTFVLCVALLGCSATQSTGVWKEQGVGYDTIPLFNDVLGTRYNEFFSKPVTVFVVHGEEAIRIGSWKEENFLLRLSTGAIALNTVGFGIQWRRDGRNAQLVVILLMVLSGVLYLAALGVDGRDLADTKDRGFQWLSANNLIVEQRRYQAVVILDAVAGVLYLAFGLYSLYQMKNQAAEPGDPWASPEEIEFRKENPTHPYGWWWHGEWEAKKIYYAETGSEPSGCCGCGTPCC
eukprot:Hpha_TRINITY_DN15930_c2_g7::TRINITY_DN15930_c2_g7_i1::g.74711::m.74711